MNFTQKIKKSFNKFIASIISGTTQEVNDSIIKGDVTLNMPEIVRKAAAEGSVLIQNNGVLPFKKDSVISVFGRIQFDYFFTGYGSGGDIKKPYQVNLVDGLSNCELLKQNDYLVKVYKDWIDNNPVDHGFWAHWPKSHPEMPLTDDIVKKAREVSNDAVVVIGRSAGEDQDNQLIKGSYYLKNEEIDMITKVSSQFDNIVLLLNIGSLIDFSWIESHRDLFGAVLINWQGGMEAGNAVWDLLSGKVSPSGKLSDTICLNYEDSPSAVNFGNREYNVYKEDIFVGYRYFETFKKEAVLYPFGYGLTYSDFIIKLENGQKENDKYIFSISVKNIGNFKAKEVVQVYVQKPCCNISNPYRELVGFIKTKELDKDETQNLTIEVSEYGISSYDSTGVLGYRSSYVLEKGVYTFSFGNNVEDAKDLYSYTYDSAKLIKQLKEVSAPVNEFEIMKADRVNEEYTLSIENAPKKTTDLKKIILSSLPKAIKQTGDLGYKLKDVKDGKITLDEFVAQLSIQELESLSLGDNSMDSPLGPKGNAGAFGGISQSLRDKGVFGVVTTDGPSGIRLSSSCSLIPIATCLACTFNTELMEELYSLVSQELVSRGSDVLLAPGMNIHRNVLCGRNFEYYSEDPFLTGVMAAAAVRGIQKEGVSACPKHFACNNQELNRIHNNSILSERALREIYLKGFELCVSLAKPKNIMTSYNKINGVWGHYNYELCKSILRDEWNFDGCIMTDWWMRNAASPEFKNLKNNAYRVRSNVNVLMPGEYMWGRKKPDKSLLKTYSKKDGITLGELQQNAKYVLNMMLKLNK